MEWRCSYACIICAVSNHSHRLSTYLRWCLAVSSYEVSHKEFCPLTVYQQNSTQNIRLLLDKTSYEMTAPGPYCSISGKPHKDYPDHFMFCPDCSTTLHMPQSPETSLPVREKAETIVIDDSPVQMVKAAKKAVYVPAVGTQSGRTNPPPSDAWQKAQDRIAAAKERNLSILRTQSSKSRAFVKEREYNVTVSIHIIPKWHEDHGFKSRLKEALPYRTSPSLYLRTQTNILKTRLPFSLRAAVRYKVHLISSNRALCQNSSAPTSLQLRNYP